MADAIVYNLAGLLAAKLGETACASTPLHDMRRGIARAKLPALALYVSEEEIFEERGSDDRHEVTVSLDYYRGPIESQNMDDRWAELRAAAKSIAVAVRLGEDDDWPTPIVPTPTPPQDPAPGTPLLELVPGLISFRLGKIRYGYFHPIAPGPGASYVGFRASLTVIHDDTYEPTDIDLLGPLVGHFTLAAEGTLPAGDLLEFQPLAAP